ncbi:MAG: GDP-mannose 4,6-dehydratase [Candidatus Brocadiaceae bacterium]|nr:GDP-mannose 4,6-dehydratase [Candidatus Brocadiaceae bacterium]
MKIGITGQSGFIGGAVARAVSGAGHQVISLDKCIRSYFADNDYPKKLDWVLHFAASTSIKASMKDPFFTYRNNIESTLAALKLSYHSRASFVFMSSYVYGQPKYLPIDEKHPIACLNPYMGSKILSEEICRQLSDMLCIPLVILRGFYIYGNCQFPGRLISDLMESVRKGIPMVLNDPAPKRDYLYIKDFEALILKIISQVQIKTGTYNVGSGHSYSNLEVAEMVRILSGGKCDIVAKSSPRSQDVSDCTVDVSLIKEAFSWEPRYSLEKGLSELIQLSAL